MLREQINAEMDELKIYSHIDSIIYNLIVNDPAEMSINLQLLEQTLNGLKPGPHSISYYNGILKILKEGLENASKRKDHLKLKSDCIFNLYYLTLNYIFRHFGPSPDLNGDSLFEFFLLCYHYLLKRQPDSPATDYIIKLLELITGILGFNYPDLRTAVLAKETAFVTQVKLLIEEYDSPEYKPDEKRILQFIAKLEASADSIDIDSDFLNFMQSQITKTFLRFTSPPSPPLPKNVKPSANHQIAPTDKFET